MTGEDTSASLGWVDCAQRHNKKRPTDTRSNRKYVFSWQFGAVAEVLHNLDQIEIIVRPSSGTAHYFSFKTNNILTSVIVLGILQRARPTQLINFSNCVRCRAFANALSLFCLHSIWSPERRPCHSSQHRIKSKYENRTNEWNYYGCRCVCAVCACFELCTPEYMMKCARLWSAFVSNVFIW